MTGVVLLLLTAVAIFAASAEQESTTPQWKHGWDSMRDQMWVDTSGKDHSTMPTEEQLDFIAEHYSIVSLEKCFALKVYPHTEDAVTAAATALKARNPNIRPLAYSSSAVSFTDCYASGNEMMAHKPEWWLKNDAGKPYYLNSDKRPYYDLNLGAVRQFVANASTIAFPNASSVLHGVFADKAGDIPLAGMDAARFAAYEKAHHESLNETRMAARRHMAPGAKLFANAFSLYPNNPQHGVEVLPYVDGVCFEHWMAFEMIDAATGNLDPAKFAEGVRMVVKASSLGKMVLVRGWPGPVVQPITALGPSWPARYPKPTPATHAERAAAAKALLTPSLAAYLIVASDTTYWTYDWWYGVDDGVVPCRNTTAAGALPCSASYPWYPELTSATKLGAPPGRSHGGGDSLQAVFCPLQRHL